MRCGSDGLLVVMGCWSWVTSMYIITHLCRMIATYLQDTASELRGKEWRYSRLLGAVLCMTDSVHSGMLRNVSCSDICLSQCYPPDWLRRESLKWPLWCRVECKMLTRVVIVVDCVVYYSTQSTFTSCHSASDSSNNCSVDDPLSMSADGVLIIKVNGSNAVASASTSDHRIQLYDIGQCLHLCIPHFFVSLFCRYKL